MENPNKPYDLYPAIHVVIAEINISQIKNSKLISLKYRTV